MKLTASMMLLDGVTIQTFRLAGRATFGNVGE
jgi:hypothetical protein